MQIPALPNRDFKGFAALLVPTRTGDPARDRASLKLLSGQTKDRLSAMGIAGRVRTSEGAVRVDGDDAVFAAEVASKFCGLSSVEVVKVAGGTLEEAADATVEAGRATVYPGEKFKVEVECDEGTGLSPTDVEYSAVGRLADALAERGSRLSDRSPDRIVRARVTRSGSYVSYLHYYGQGGLPVGLNGRAVVLHSGGVASFHAALETMKAGLEVTLLYLYTKKTPPAHLRRAVAAATLLREHQPTPKMELVAADFGGPLRAIGGSFTEVSRLFAAHRAMASGAGWLARKEGAAWMACGLTVDSGVENLSAYSAEVAAGGMTAMFPVASKSSEALWGSIGDGRLKARMPRLRWRLLPHSGAPRVADARGFAREWAESGISRAVDRSMEGAFSVDLGRGFIDYFGCMDSFSSQLRRRGTP